MWRKSLSAILKSRSNTTHLVVMGCVVDLIRVLYNIRQDIGKRSMAFRYVRGRNGGVQKRKGYNYPTIPHISQKTAHPIGIAYANINNVRNTNRKYLNIAPKKCGGRPSYRRKARLATAVVRVLALLYSAVSHPRLSPSPTLPGHRHRMRLHSLEEFRRLFLSIRIQPSNLIGISQATLQ